MKLNQINHLIEWTSEAPNMFDLQLKFTDSYILKNFSPKFKIIIKDENNQVLDQKEANIFSESFARKGIENFYLFKAELMRSDDFLLFGDFYPYSSRKLLNWHAPYEFKNKYDLNFEFNYNKYYSIYNETGFFNKLIVSIIDEQENIVFEDIFEIENLNQSLNISNLIELATKDYESKSVEFLINEEYAKNFNISKIICLPIVNGNILKKDLIIKDVKRKTSFENYDYQDIKDFNFIVVPLNEIEFNIFNFLNSKELNINNILNIKNQTFYKKYVLDKNIFLQKNDSKVEIYFHGPLYLFNEDSYNNISWPQEFEQIKNIKYKKYFPISNKNLNTFTKLVNPNYNLYQNYNSNQTEAFVPEYIGYKYLENDQFVNQNINLDINQILSMNIKNISILNVQNLTNKNIIYIELVSLISSDYINNISTEFLSTNFQLLSKGIKVIDGINHASFVLKYEYDPIFTNQEIIKDNLLEDKIFIDLRFKLNI